MPEHVIKLCFVGFAFVKLCRGLMVPALSKAAGSSSRWNDSTVALKPFSTCVAASYPHLQEHPEGLLRKVQDSYKMLKLGWNLPHGRGCV